MGMSNSSKHGDFNKFSANAFTNMHCISRQNKHINSVIYLLLHIIYKYYLFYFLCKAKLKDKQCDFKFF